MHVEKIQERHFLEIKKSNAKKYTGFGVGGGGLRGALGYRGGYWGVGGDIRRTLKGR